MPSPSITPSARRRRRIFRVIAVLLGLMVIPAVELLLTLVGFGLDTSLIIRNVEFNQPDQNTGTHQLNGLADLVYFGITDLSGPEIRPFTLPKPTNLYRVVVLGESTVIGFPYAAELAFPRLMQIQLQAQMPERRIEVLNAGITGINSFAIADLARQATAAEPDLVVIHAGHNEYYGPGGPGSSVFNYPPLLISAAFRLRHLRLPQLLSGGYQVEEAREDLLNVLPAQPNIELNSPTYIQGRENFRTNLSRAVDYLTQARIPVLIVPTACNLRDQSPLLSTWPARKKGRGDWRRHLTEAEQQMSVQNPAKALESLRAAEEVLAEQAELQFRLGQCLQALGRKEEARSAFELARDYDNCRFRMPSEFNEVAQQVIQGRDNCWYFDLSAAFVAAGYEDSPGAELFLEHVHYTFDGHHVVGQLLSNFIVEKCLHAKWKPDRVIELDEMKELTGFVLEDDLVALSHALQVFETTPFRACLDLQNHQQRLIDRIRQRYLELPPSRQNVFADVPFSTLTQDVIQALAAAHRKAGHLEEARFLESRRSLRRPWGNHLPQRESENSGTIQN